MKTNRLPRFRRAAQAPSWELTGRDVEVLRALLTFRLMTREQIERLLFPPEDGQDHPTKTSICRRRLKLLYHHGYLERIPMPAGAGLWAWRPVYRLAPKGAELIALEQGIPSSQLPYWGKGFDKDHRPTDVRTLFLDHALQVNDVRLAFTLAAQKHGYRIEQWIDDTELKSQTMKDYVRVSRGDGENVRVAVVPDAYVVLDLGDRRARFFLELDRATMSNTRWRTRILAYVAYMASGKYIERFQSHSLRILTVTTTPARLTGLKKTTEKAAGEKLSRRFWFTTLDQALADQVFDVPIWFVGGEQSPSPLISQPVPTNPL